MLSKDSLVQELRNLFTEFLIQKNIELVDLICGDQNHRLVLKVFVDKVSGITLGECALVNRQLQGLLEENKIIPGDYFLEVASPGLDRALKTEKDFLRCIDQEVVFYLNDLIGGKCQWQGKVKYADSLNVQIENREGIFEIPLLKINKAKLVF